MCGLCFNERGVVESLFNENKFVDSIVFLGRFSKTSLTKYLTYGLSFHFLGY